LIAIMKLESRLGESAILPVEEHVLVGPLNNTVLIINDDARVAVVGAILGARLRGNFGNISRAGNTLRVIVVDERLPEDEGVEVAPIGGVTICAGATGIVDRIRHIAASLKIITKDTGVVGRSINIFTEISQNSVGHHTVHIMPAKLATKGHINME